MSPLEAGTQAPDFSLSDQGRQSGSPRRPARQEGADLFLSQGDDPGCTTQACGLRDVNSELAALNVVVLGINPDSAKRLKKFEARQPQLPPAGR